MIAEPRLYRDEQDLDAMRSLLRQGRLADNGSYYVHQGDLNWWLFYPPLDYDFWRSIYLWDDPDEVGSLLGWTLISPGGETFDVYVRPDLRGTPRAWMMYRWALHRLDAIARVAGREHIGMMWVAEDDDLLRSWLRGQGFALARAAVYMTCRLEVPRPDLQVPAGMLVRSSQGVSEVRQRAAAQYSAFESSADIERYVQRFTRFMHSPVYDPEWNVVAATSDGCIGAFCITWPDPVNRVGLFEPVGTHPDFQRKGLGRAVMLEAMDRLERGGMRTAIVSTGEDNLPAIRLYEAVGFKTTRRLLFYKRKLE
jgi:ribosomal protein S18 acetylase RimI-like enzyme